MRKFALFGWLTLVGCQRGCLTSWIASHSKIDSRDATAAPFVLSAIDCPDGLVRCRGGVAERSTTGAVASDCTPSLDKPHACDCPFVTVAPCPFGCVVDDVEIADIGNATRICAPAPGVVFAAPSVASAPLPVCENETARFRCEHGTVLACARSGAEPVSTCLHGCLVEDEELEADEVDVRAATSLLCRRAPLER